MNTFLIRHDAEFKKVIDYFLIELGQLRAGRATPALVEGIIVEVYGARSPLVQIASISIPEARQIVIQPWDKSLLKNIEKAIAESGLGLNPANEGDCIRIVIPALTEERRRELVKVVGKKTEESRVRMRGLRENIKESILVAEKNKELSEDERFRFIEELDTFTKSYQERIDQEAQKKEEEILS
ncbi:MAG TPA: ribosome recycling factor [Patescibacteria group bacterium]|nr:ribosome recycling factor [Patescibacteria group bacterium]